MPHLLIREFKKRAPPRKLLSHVVSHLLRDFMDNPEIDEPEIHPEIRPETDDLEMGLQVRTGNPSFSDVCTIPNILLFKFEIYVYFYVSN